MIMCSRYAFWAMKSTVQSLHLKHVGSNPMHTYMGASPTEPNVTCTLVNKHRIAQLVIQRGCVLYIFYVVRSDNKELRNSLTVVCMWEASHFNAPSVSYWPLIASETFNIYRCCVSTGGKNANPQGAYTVMKQAQLANGFSLSISAAAGFRWALESQRVNRQINAKSTNQTLFWGCSEMKQQ